MPTTRRSVLLAALTLGGTATWTACSDADTATTRRPSPAPSPAGGDSPMPNDSARPRVLLAFFSRAGENYYYGDRIDLRVGNTKVLARMIADRIGCDLYEILASDPYPDDYDATVQRNVEEQDADARPEIAGDLPNLRSYDVVLLASPIWNVRPPMIMRTFAEALDFTGKLVHPVVTYAVSGMGTAERDYTEACAGASLRDGLAVQGEAVADAGPDVDSWLSKARLI